MHSIVEAKRHLRDIYKHEEGFVGIGIDKHNNEDVLCVYVTDSNSPVARQLKHDGSFEGFPVEVEVSGLVQALPVGNRNY